MTGTRTRMTAGELLALPDDGKRHELVEGELREMPLSGARHGSVTATLMSLLGQHISVERLGEVFAPGTGFVLSHDPEIVRAPDLSFVPRERVPPDGPPEGYWELAPDLAVEVVSPNDTAAEVQNRRSRCGWSPGSVWCGSYTRYPLCDGLQVFERDQHLHRRGRFERGRRRDRLRVQGRRDLRVETPKRWLTPGVL